MEEKYVFPKYDRMACSFGKINVKDITLREGEQTADVAFTVEEKTDLAFLLSDAGIPWIQIGFSANPDDCRAVKVLKETGCKARLELLTSGVAPTWQKQIDANVACGADDVSIFFRIADSHIADLGLTREDVKKKAAEMTTYAKQSGTPRVVFGPTFVTRADPAFFLEVARTAVTAGADQISIADTTGVGNPNAFRFLVDLVKKTLDVEVGVHCHNDFGLALANSVEAVQRGATSIEASLGGFGDRAGNTATEELVPALTLLYGVDLGIDVKKIADAARHTFQTVKMSIPPLKPIIGSNVFAQKVDVHVMNTRTKPWMNEPFDPAIVGGERKLALGKGSGPIAVAEKAKRLGIELPADKVDAVVKRVNTFAETNKRTLTDDEFAGIIRELTA